MKTFIVTSLILTLLSINGFSQQKLSTKSKKAAELYYQADNFRVRGQYLPAIDLLNQAIKKDKGFYEAYFRLGVIYKAKGDLKVAEDLLNSVLEINPNAPGALFELSELYLKEGRYKESLEKIEGYFALNPRNRARIAEGKSIKKSAKFGIENAQNISEFKPRALSDTVNAFPMQYFPIVTVDQQAILFTRRMGTTIADDEDIVISYKDENGRWKYPVSLSENINTAFNEGTCTISADGRTLILTSCVGRKGFGSCDLFVSHKLGNEWSKPKNLGGAINSSSWDSQPALSADGRTLYFVSNRKGGVGRRDIWVSEKNDKGIWQKAKNLGRNVNSVNDEVSPFMHPNNRTLYFASNGWVGFGGLDIFYTEYDTGKWNEPQNLGAPINTGEDQVALFITSDGERGYYSNENNERPDRKNFIYEFDVPKNARVKYRTSFVKGIVKDSENMKPLAANIELYDLSIDKRVSLVKSDSISGEYLMVLTQGSEYALYINKERYLFKSLSFDYDLNENLEPIEIDILLDPLKQGVTTELKNIFFDLNKYDLKEKSKTELKKVVSFLLNNPKIRIEISGHTDNTGGSQYNLQLSTNRAKSVYDFLINQSVPKASLIYKGYGDKIPAYSNSQEADRKRNRRIEFTIL